MLKIGREAHLVLETGRAFGLRRTCIYTKVPFLLLANQAESVKGKADVYTLKGYEPKPKDGTRLPLETSATRWRWLRPRPSTLRFSLCGQAIADFWSIFADKPISQVIFGDQFVFLRKPSSISALGGSIAYVPVQSRAAHRCKGNAATVIAKYFGAFARRGCRRNEPGARISTRAPVCAWSIRNSPKTARRYLSDVALLFLNLQEQRRSVWRALRAVGHSMHFG